MIDHATESLKELLYRAISLMLPRARRVIAMTATRTLLPVDGQVLTSWIGPHFFLVRFIERFDVDCVFDVGANRRQFKTMVREVIGFYGPIIPFEPLPVLAGGLRRRARSALLVHRGSCA
jgi:hypothetical protein